MTLKQSENAFSYGYDNIHTRTAMQLVDDMRADDFKSPAV